MDYDTSKLNENYDTNSNADTTKTYSKIISFQRHFIIKLKNFNF